MTTLTAWAFPGAGDAEEAIKRLEDLQSQGHITIDDAAVVSWEADKKKPKTRQLHNTRVGVHLAAHSGGCSSGCSSWYHSSAQPSALRWVHSARR